MLYTGISRSNKVAPLQRQAARKVAQDVWKNGLPVEDLDIAEPQKKLVKAELPIVITDMILSTTMFYPVYPQEVSANITLTFEEPAEHRYLSRYLNDDQMRKRVEISTNADYIIMHRELTPTDELFEIVRQNPLFLRQLFAEIWEELFSENITDKISPEAPSR